MCESGVWWRDDCSDVIEDCCLGSNVWVDVRQCHGESAMLVTI